MSYEKRDFAGGAAETTISGSINATATSITLASSTGWPTGGANGKFYAVLDDGAAGEEKILVESRSGTTLTLASSADRGVDGTSATTHSSGATIKHCISAQDSSEANYWVAELATAATAANDLIIADADNSLSRVAKGSNSTVLQVSSGGTLQYGTVTSAMIADATIVAGDIVNATITETQLAASVAGNGLAGGAGTALSVNVDGTNIEINADTLRLKDLGVVTAKINDLAVTTGKIADSAVTSAKIADGTIVVADLAAALQAYLNPAGVVQWTASASIPTGWLAADGSSVLRATYPDLFTAIGTTYGAADGTHFNLPDITGRVIAGKEASATRLTNAISGVTGSTLGSAGGSQSQTAHTHTGPSHTHTGPSHTHSPFGGGNFVVTSGGAGAAITVAAFDAGGVVLKDDAGTTAAGTGATGASGTAATGSTGAGAAENVQPTIVLNAIIKT